MSDEVRDLGTKPTKAEVSLVTSLEDSLVPHEKKFEEVDEDQHTTDDEKDKYSTLVRELSRIDKTG